MRGFNLIILLLLGYYIYPALPSEPRFKRDSDHLHHISIIEIQEVGRSLEKLSTALTIKLQEVKTQLRDEIEEIIKSEFKREMDEIKSQLVVRNDNIHSKLEEMDAKIDGIMNLRRCEENMTFVEINATSKDSDKNLGLEETPFLNLSSIILSNNSDLVIIQRRGTPLIEGRIRENFKNRNWTEYENGFGSEDADFWIGLKNIHNLTEAGFTELRVDLEDWEGNKAHASYSSFAVADSSDDYRLSIAGYSGNAGDSMEFSAGARFSTVDMDNDGVLENCALDNGGPWWHQECSNSVLNFDYQNESNVEYRQGIIWYDWKGWEYSLKKTEMKIRRPTSVSSD